MKRIARLFVCLFTSLTMAIAVAPPKALAAGSPEPSSNGTPDRIAEVAQLAVPITTAPQVVAQARKAASSFRYLLPRGFQLTQAHARLFRVGDDSFMVAVPLGAEGLSGGSFTFLFENGTLVLSQQVIIEELSEISGRVRAYTDGVLSLDRTLTNAEAPNDSFMSASSTAFNRCYNNLPGWIKDVMTLMCTVGCLGAANPILMMWCVMCLLGLGGVYASYALKCLNAK